MRFHTGWSNQNIHVTVYDILDDRTDSDFISDMTTSGSPGIDRLYLMSNSAQPTINVQPYVIVPSDMATNGSPGIDRLYLMSDIAQPTINVQPYVIVPRPDYLSAFVRWTHAG